MGNCGGSTSKQIDAGESKKNRQIDKLNRDQRDQENIVQKLLLLGTGESGKSTLFKQVVDLYGAGFKQAELQEFKSAVFLNTLQSMQTILRQCEELPASDPAKHGDCDLKGELKEEQELVLSSPIDSSIDEKLAVAIEKLWQLPAVKACYEKRSLYQLPVTAEYFFNRVREFAKPTYEPTKQDILQVRVRTTGVIETEFQSEGFVLKLIDVGGQRSERRKWIGCFKGIDAVLFVAAISEYDQKLFEDDNVSRMDEALNVWEEVTAHEMFKRTKFMLFLNKRDLFREKLKKVPLKTAFPDYDGPDEFEPAWKHISKVFLSRTRLPRESVYVHCTCATDDDNVRFVFTAVRDIVVVKALKDAELFL